MEIWPWKAKPLMGKAKPITVHAVTYEQAKVAACRAFGLVTRKFDRDEAQLEKVEVRVVFEYEIAAARKDRAA